MLINVSGPETRQSKTKEYEDQLKQWHRYFTLIPRRVNEQQIAWLQYIERRGEKYKGMCQSPEMKAYPCWRWRWEYRIQEKES